MKRYGPFTVFLVVAFLMVPLAISQASTATGQDALSLLSEARQAVETTQSHLDSAQAQLDTATTQLETATARLNELEALLQEQEDSGGTGLFQVAGGAIYDPEGNPFLPMGTSLTLGSYNAAWWKSAGPEKFTPEIVNALRDNWKFTAVRLNMCNGAHCDPVVNPFDDPAVDEQIQTITDAGLIAWLDHKSITAGSEPTAAEIEQAKADLGRMATKFKDNPRVWIQLWDEPGTGFTSEWKTWHEPLLQHLRELGWVNPIIVNGAHYGQDQAGDGKVYYPENSAILTHGPELAEQYGPIVFDVHTYHRWAVPDTAEIADFFKEAQGLGLTVVNGGVGWPAERDSWLDDNDRIAAIAFYQQKTPGVGVVSWHGAVRSYTMVDLSNGRYVWDYTDTTNLTEFGTYHWDFTHSPPPAEPAA